MSTCTARCLSAKTLNTGSRQPLASSRTAYRPCPARSLSKSLRNPEVGRRQLQLHQAIRAKENYDTSFDLADDNKSALQGLLASEAFCAQVARESKLEEGRQLCFTEMLFQPVPWSVHTKKGMPAEFEKFLDDSRYVFINVPPNFMFKAKIFKPSRLCAIYETKS